MIKDDMIESMLITRYTEWIHLSYKMCDIHYSYNECECENECENCIWIYCIILDEEHAIIIKKPEYINSYYSKFLLERGCEIDIFDGILHSSK